MPFSAQTVAGPRLLLRALSTWLITAFALLVLFSFVLSRVGTGSGLSQFLCELLRRVFRRVFLPAPWTGEKGASEPCSCSRTRDSSALGGIADRRAAFGSFRHPQRRFLHCRRRRRRQSALSLVRKSLSQGFAQERAQEPDFCFASSVMIAKTCSGPVGVREG